MRGRWKTLFTTALILTTISICAADWPQHRGDNTNSGQYGGAAALQTHGLNLQWTFPLEGRVTTAPTLADVDADGRIEILFGSEDKKIHALDYSGREKWSYRTLGAVRSTPLAADVNFDGRIEIIFGSDDRKIYAVDSAGNLLWTVDTGGPVAGSPTAADLDPAAGLETIIGSTDGSVYVIASDGAVLKRVDVSAPTESTPALADLDADGRDEIIIGAGKRIYAINYLDDATAAYPTEGDVTTAPTVLGGVIIAASGDGSVRALNYAEKWVWTGEAEEKMTPELTLRWKQQIDGKITASPARTNELIAAAAGNRLYLLNTQNGEVTRKYAANAPATASPMFAKLADGRMGIVYGTNDGTLYIVDDGGQTLWSYTCESPMGSSPTAADFDEDGKLELAAGSDDRLYFFGTATPPTTAPTTTTEPTTTTAPTTTMAQTTTTAPTTTSEATTTTTAPATTTSKAEAATTTAPQVALTSMATGALEENKTGNAFSTALNTGFVILIILIVGTAAHVFREQKKPKTPQNPPQTHGHSH